MTYSVPGQVEMTLPSLSQAMLSLAPAEKAVQCEEMPRVETCYNKIITMNNHHIVKVL